MPVLGDFETILNDGTVVIGDNSNKNGWTAKFNTGGRRSDKTAYITFMVRGMTAAVGHAEVFVNEVKVGDLFNNNGGAVTQWQTQIVSLGGHQLNNGSNDIRVSSVQAAPPHTGLDDFAIRNVICHFHQDAA